MPLYLTIQIILILKNPQRWTDTSYLQATTAQRCSQSHSGRHVLIISKWRPGSADGACPRGLEGSNFVDWHHIAVAYGCDREAVNGANADPLCASRSEEEVGESTFGSFIYNKLRG